MSDQIARALLFILGAIPLRLRQVTGGFFGRLFFLFPTTDRLVARLQLERFLGTTQPAVLARDVYAHFGQTALECLNLKPILDQKIQLLEYPGLPAFRTAVKSDRPVIILTAHFGNWELLAAYVIAEGAPLVTIGRPARIKLLQALSAQIRAASGLRTIWRLEGPGGLKELVSALKRGEVLAALVDQDTRVRSLPIPFFGALAATPSTLVELGLRLNARFFSAFITRDPHSDKRIALMDEISLSEMSEFSILTEFNQRLENVIRQDPSQWVWFHKRWRTKFEDSQTPRRRSGAEYIRELKE